MICSRCNSETEARDGTLCKMTYPCQREELDEDMKLKQKENAFKMHNIFNKQDLKTPIHKIKNSKNSSKTKRLHKYSMTNSGFGKIKNLTKDTKGNLMLFDKGFKKIPEEKDYIEEQVKYKSTRNVLFCNNNKCYRAINNNDGNFILIQTSFYILYLNFFKYFLI